MSEETVAWLIGVHWHTVLTTGHVAGMILVICAAVAGYAMGAPVLFLRGRRPARALVGLVHNSVVVGLLLVWCSGGGLLLVKNMIGPQAVWTAALSFKLTAVGLLSLSVWLVRVFVLPLAYSRPRPLAVHLDWAALVGVSLVASVSMSCWIILVATALSAEMQALPVERLFGFLVGLIFLFEVACLALVAGVRILTPQRRPDVTARTASRRHRQLDVRPGLDARHNSAPPGRSMRTSEQASTQQPTLTGLTQHAINAMQARPLPQRMMVPQSRSVQPPPEQQRPAMPRQPAPSLSYRLRQSHYQDPAQHLRDKVAQEWSRNARPAAPRPRWTQAAAAAAQAAAVAAARESEADDWLLQKWLRRPR
ncbi:MAG: hypothetical protein JXQ99_07205 [Hyphomicrobiaceae bacterium]